MRGQPKGEHWEATAGEQSRQGFVNDIKDHARLRLFQMTQSGAGAP
jgi:hypothetical protein